MNALINDPVINEIVSRLVKGPKVERIYLFGSKATGKSGPASDIDLLIVVPGSNLPRHKREADFYDLLWGVTTPVDVIVLTDAEFQRAAQVRTSLASTAKNKGVLVYG